MAFNLRNFGTALGGLTSGYNAAQDAYLRQAISRQAMQAQQRQQQAETLAALALMGGNIPGLGGFANAGGGMQNIPTPPMPGAASTPAAPPMGGQAAPQGNGQPPAPQQAPAPPPMMGAGTYYGSNTFAPTNPATGGAVPGRYSDALLTPMEPVQVEELPPPGGGTALPAPAAKDYDITNTKDLRMPSGTPDVLSDAGTAPGVPPPGGYGAGEAVSAPGRPGEPPARSAGMREAPSSEAPAEPHVLAQAPGGPVMSLGNLFQAVNPQALAQAISRTAPPGTDPAAIFEATQKLVQMANGNKQEQIMAAQLGKLLDLKFTWAQRKDIEQGKEQTQRDIAAGRETAAAGRQQAAFGEREKLQNQRLKQQQDQFDARLQQAKSAQSKPQTTAQLRALLSDIDRQLNPGGFGIQPTGDELLQLQQQRVQIVNELRKLSGMPPVPTPQAQPTQ